MLRQPSSAETAPRAGDPPARISSERMTGIVREAAGLFDAHGYHQTSMDDLAAAVGIAKPTLYHYFDSKASILSEIHRQFIDTLLDRQRRRSTLDLVPSEQLRSVMEDILGLMDSHRGHVRVFFEHHRDLPPDHKSAVRAQRLEYQSMVEHIIRAGISAGEFRDVDPQLTALAVFGMCNWAYHWYSSSGGRTSEQVARFMWTFALEGLAVPSPRAGS